MVSIPLGRGSWVRRRADEPGVEAINRFFEENPINTAEGTALIERPALIQYLTSGDGPGRRLFTQPGFANGALFHVSGDELWKHVMNANRTVTTSQISGFVDGDSAPDMAATDTYLWIADGVELMYTNGTAALTAITTPDDIPIISIDVFNGYVLCVQSNSDRFYWIEPGDNTIDPLNFATAERFPDKIMDVRVVGDEFWLLGERSIEVWRATGDGDAPFQRIEGRAYNFGIIRGSTTRMKNTSVLVVANDGTVFQIAGIPVPISNPSIAERTRDAIRVMEEENLI